MTEQEILARVGRAGWTVISRGPHMVVDPVAPKLGPQPDGNEEWQISNGQGLTQPMVVKATDSPVPGAIPGTNRPGPAITSYDLVSPPENLPSSAMPTAADTAAKQATTAQTTAQTAGLTAEQQQRDRNKAATGYALTDAELASLQSTGAGQDLTRRGQDITAQGTARGQDITAQGQANDKAYQDAQIALATANQALAVRKQASDENDQKTKNELAAGRLTLEQAQQRWTEDFNKLQLAQQDADRAQRDVAMAETRRSNQAGESIQGQQLALTQRGQDVTAATAARGQDITARGQQQSADQALLNTMADLRNAGTTAATSGAQIGAGLLQNRVTSSTGALNGVLGSTLGAQNFGLGSKLPAGWGDALVQGVGDFTTQMGGGPEVYTQAAQLVKNLNPAIAASQDGQAIVGQLADMLGKYKAMTGQDHPQVASPATPTTVAGAAPSLPAPLPTPAPNFVSPATGPPVATVGPATRTIQPWGIPGWNQITGSPFQSPKAWGIGGLWNQGTGYPFMSPAA